MIDSVFGLSTNYSTRLIETSGMLLPLCSMRWGFSNDCHGKSNTPHAHYECTLYQNITLAGSYWRATDDPRVTNSTAFIYNYKQMGNASEYKTFNGQIGKGQGISAPSPHNYSSTPGGVTLVTRFNNLCETKSSQQGSTEKTFIWANAMLTQCRVTRLQMQAECFLTTTASKR